MGILGPSGRPAREISYQLGPNLLKLNGDPIELFTAALPSTDPSDMVRAMWASSSVALAHAGNFIGQFELRLQALERLLGRDPQFAAAYKAELEAVSGEMKAAHEESLRQGPGGPAN